MSTPNEPDESQNSGTTPPQGGSGTPSSAPTRSTVVPPWQRGSASVGEGQPQGAPRPPGDRPQDGSSQSGDRRPGPPPRGVVTAPGPQPVTKLENPRNDAPPAEGGRPNAGDSKPATAGEVAKAAAAERNAPTQKFVESPTSNIDREDLPKEQLPNLDKIHHVDEVEDKKRAVATVTRSAPVQVGAGTPLRASVQLRRIDPWATFKIAAVLSVVGFFIWMIATAVLYLVLDGMGIWEQVNSSFGTLVTPDGGSTDDLIGAGTVFGGAALIGAINAILITALATVGAYIYNLCADMVGGAEVTLADLD